MIITYWITWQCADNDSGQYFLTKVPNGHVERTIEDLMEVALAIEEVERGTPYQIASILRTYSGVEVVY